jgi:N-acetyl sugar amidotransferase
MYYCSRCTYPSNHPLYLTFDKKQVCSGCRTHEEKDEIDWSCRFKKLEDIVESYRNKSGNNYDCVIPVSGGKDSYFIVHTAIKTLGLNPLLVTFNSGYNTKIGIRNLANLLTKFDCDCIEYTIGRQLTKRLTRKSLKTMGSMYWHVLAGRSTYPVQVAAHLKIPLIIWGSNGWMDQIGQFSHDDEIEMTKKVRKEHALMRFDAEDMIDEELGITAKDVKRFKYPSDHALQAVGVRGIYLDNFIRWDSKTQHELMIDLYDYETCAQERTFNTYEDVECFHLAGLHDYVRFLKYGFGTVSDHASREIRLKRMTREEGIDMVSKYQHVIPSDFQVFLDWIDMSKDEFYATINKFRDPKAWENKNGEWILKDSVINHKHDPNIDLVRLNKIEECEYIITPCKEPKAKEDGHIIMGRGYINPYNNQAIDDNQVDIIENYDKAKYQLMAETR